MAACGGDRNDLPLPLRATSPPRGCLRPLASAHFSNETRCINIEKETGRKKSKPAAKVGGEAG
jgi:hypothetical protein